MKLGLERERFGDIIVFDDEAYVIVFLENAEYVRENLSHLTSLKKATIEVVDVNKVKVKELKFEDIKIVISSERLDNFVAELSKCSRKIAQEQISLERVLVNNTVEIRQEKDIKIGDILTIRRVGKFIVSEFVGKNKKDRKIYLLKKYV